MLCMWILFYMSSKSATTEMLSALDQDDNVSARILAFKLANQTPLANEDERRRVTEFFAHSLADDPKARQSSIGSLVTQLRNIGPVSSPTDSKVPNARPERDRYSNATSRKFEVNFWFYLRL
jgi:hypothetical protein